MTEYADLLRWADDGGRAACTADEVTPHPAREAMPTPDDCDPVQDRKHARETAIPTERLSETREFRDLARNAQRLHMAFDLFRTLFAGHSTPFHGSTTRLRQWCWEQADAFLADATRPPPAAPSAAVADPLSEHEHTYLAWLQLHGDAMPSDHPPLDVMSAWLAAHAKRSLVKSGHVVPCLIPAGGRQESHGFRISGAGKAALLAAHQAAA
jgi:hypothetical protein